MIVDTMNKSNFNTANEIYTIIFEYEPAADIMVDRW